MSVSKIAHGYFHVSTFNVYTCVNDRRAHNPPRPCAPTPARPCEACAGWNVRLAARRITQFLEQRMEGAGPLLRPVRADGRDRLGGRRHDHGALAERMGLDQSTLSRTLAHARGRRVWSRSPSSRAISASAWSGSPRKARDGSKPLSSPGGRRMPSWASSSRSISCAPAGPGGRTTMTTNTALLDSRTAWITASAALAILTLCYGAPLVVGGRHEADRGRARDVALRPRRRRLRRLYRRGVRRHRRGLAGRASWACAAS